MITRKMIKDNILSWMIGEYTEKKTNDLKFYDICKTLNDGNKNFNRFSYIFDAVYSGENKMLKDGLPWCATFVITSIGTSAIGNFTCIELYKMRKEGKDNYLLWNNLFKDNIEIVTKINKNSQCWTAGVAEIAQFMGNNALIRIDQIKEMDLITFGNNAHIGFILDYDGTYIQTCEGNTSKGSTTSNGGQVCKKIYKIKNNSLIEIINFGKRNQVEINSWSSFKLLKLAI